jgi:hypothetical protein
MKMPKSDNDVKLTDGERFTVKEEPYQHHIRTTVETKQVDICMPEHPTSA